MTFSGRDSLAISQYVHKDCIGNGPGLETDQVRLRDLRRRKTTTPYLIWPKLLRRQEVQKQVASFL